MKTKHFKIEFHHNNNKFNDIPNGTTVTIKKIGTNNIIASGSVKLHYKDQFCRAKGRIEALRKAIRLSAVLTKEEKKEIMEAYVKNYKLA